MQKALRDARRKFLQPILRVVPKKARKTSSPACSVCIKSQSKWLRCWSGTWKRKVCHDYPESSQLFSASMSPQRQAWTHIERASTPTWKLDTSMKPMTTRRGSFMTLLSGLRPTKSRSWTKWGKGWRASTPQCLPSCSRTPSPNRRSKCTT